jgi:phage recombination protein Bet
MPESKDVALQGPRLPYFTQLEESLGVDKGQWKVLVETVWPNAKSAEAVMMAIRYCRERQLDPFKRPVHVVPMWNSALNRMVETVWPGISELRTTAFRTGQYAGCDETKWGPPQARTFEGEVDNWERGQKVGTKKISVTVDFPDWAQITVWRMIGGQRVPFHGPKTFWLESYATIGKTDVPNDMWQSRPAGQLEKVAEAAALRKAFPEEIGSEMTMEEMAGRRQDVEVAVERVAQPDLASVAAPPPAPDVETINVNVASTADSLAAVRDRYFKGDVDTHLEPRTPTPTAEDLKPGPWNEDIVDAELNEENPEDVLRELEDVLATATTEDEIISFYREGDFATRLSDSHLKQSDALVLAATSRIKRADPFATPITFRSADEYSTWIDRMVAAVNSRETAGKLKANWEATKSARPAILDQDQNNILRNQVVVTLRPYTAKATEKPQGERSTPEAPPQTPTTETPSRPSVNGTGADPTKEPTTAEEFYAQCASVLKWDDQKKIQDWRMGSESWREKLNIQQAPEWKRKWKIALMDRIEELGGI